MSAMEIGTKLVQLCNDGKPDEAMNTLYSDNIVSIEAQGSDEMPARMEGIDAIRGKAQWWYDNHTIHKSTALGPFVGGRENQFAVQFEMDLTTKATGERGQMKEIGIYTVEDGKVVEEEFWYLMG